MMRALMEAIEQPVTLERAALAAGMTQADARAELMRMRRWGLARYVREQWRLDPSCRARRAVTTPAGAVVDSTTPYAEDEVCRALVAQGARGIVEVAALMGLDVGQARAALDRGLRMMKARTR